MHLNRQIHTKVENYCAYQERSQQEVRDKLYSLGLHKAEVEHSIVQLIEDGFLNEERFALAFAQGKHRLKKWGRFKIKQALQLKSVSEPLIRFALQSLDEEEYQENLKTLLLKNAERIKTKNNYEFQMKMIQFAYMKGYEKELTLYILKDLDF